MHRNSLDTADLSLVISDYLIDSGLIGSSSYDLQSLSGDGSDRSFYLVTLDEGRDSLLLVLPSKSNPRSLAEARSCNLIGCHLAKLGVPVPQVLFYEEQSGAIIYEYLGEQLLFDIIRSLCVDSSQFLGSSQTSGERLIEKNYQRVIDQLVKMQITGRQGFAEDFCWETAFYDQGLMLERESGYFLLSFCRDFTGLTDFDRQLTLEFEQLAQRVAQEPADFLLHRDFQSRNIMLQDNKVRIIDFQGARFGPLAYDLASLLNDPYVSLSYKLRDKLLDFYVDRAGEYISLDRSNFIEGYSHIALQRNLQVLGAFAFLAKEKGKGFFLHYIIPALDDLSYKMSGLLKENYPALSELILTIQSEQKWKKQIYR